MLNFHELLFLSVVCFFLFIPADSEPSRHACLSALLAGEFRSSPFPCLFYQPKNLIQTSSSPPSPLTKTLAENTALAAFARYSVSFVPAVS